MKAYRNNDRRRTSIINVDYNSGRNSLIIDGKEISLDSVESISVFSDNFVVMLNGIDNSSEEESSAKDELWSGMDGSVEILLVKDTQNRISMIDLFDGENTTSLVADLTTRDYVEIDEHNYEEFIDPNHNLTSDVDVLPSDLVNHTSNIHTGQSGLAQSDCDRCRKLKIAIAATADFCYWSGMWTDYYLFSRSL